MSVIQHAFCCLLLQWQDTLQRLGSLALLVTASMYPIAANHMVNMHGELHPLAALLANNVTVSCSVLKAIP